MPGFPFKVLIKVIQLVLQLLEWLAADNDEEKSKVERQ